VDNLDRGLGDQHSRRDDHLLLPDLLDILSIEGSMLGNHGLSSLLVFTYNLRKSVQGEFKAVISSNCRER